MKKAVLVFLIAAVVLFTVNLTSANDSNIPATIRGINGLVPLMDEEAKKIGGPMIPPNAQRVTIPVNSEKEELMLAPNDYLIIGEGGEVLALSLEETTFIPLLRGSYTLYIVPKKSSPAMEMMKRRAAQRP